MPHWPTVRSRSVVAPRLVALVEERKPGFVLIGASNDGKDIAGHCCSA